MLAGRELDAYIDEHLFGNSRFLEDGFLFLDGCPNYSTELSDALEIVKKLPGTWCLHSNTRWSMTLILNVLPMQRFDSSAETLPHAISLIALQVARLNI